MGLFGPGLLRILLPGRDKHGVIPSSGYYIPRLVKPVARYNNQGIVLKSQVISTTLIDKNIYMLISKMVSIK